MTKRPVHRQERGAVLIIVAISITALLLIVAIVIDLGFTRSDRRDGQLAVDNASSSAALALAEFGAERACTSALQYLRVSLETGPFAIANGDTCASVFSAACASSAPATPERRLFATSGPYTVTVIHPVVDSELLDRASTIAASSFGPLSSADGPRCERIGVKVTTSGSAFFGGIGGATERVSTVHAVARGRVIDGPDRPINLLILNRTQCSSLVVGGSANVIVDRPTDSLTSPGIVGVDAQVTQTAPTCNPNKSTVEVSGTLRAYGICAATGVYGPCGIIGLHTPVTTGACKQGAGQDRPACEANGGSAAVNDAKIQPNAVTTTERTTRQPFDHRYDCRTQAQYDAKTWSSVQPISGCPGATSVNGYATDVVNHAKALIAASGGSWNVVPSTDCSPAGTVEFTEGNWFVDCDTYKLNAGVTVRFKSGNVVFKGEVDLSSSATLGINDCVRTADCTIPGITWSRGDAFDKDSYSAKHSWAYVPLAFRAAGTFDFNNTTLFIGEAGHFNQTADAFTNWTAPDEGSIAGSAGPFDDLSLWSESSMDHVFRGGGTSVWDGVYFGPLAKFDFSGNGVVDMKSAQFAADKMAFGGTATYTMSPVAERAVSTTLGYTTSLIR